MKLINSFILLVILSVTLNAQSYFPPNSSSNWDSISPSSLDYCQTNIDSSHYLDANNTKRYLTKRRQNSFEATSMNIQTLLIGIGHRQVKR